MLLVVSQISKGLVKGNAAVGCGDQLYFRGCHILLHLLLFLFCVFFLGRRCDLIVMPCLQD